MTGGTLTTNSPPCFHLLAKPSGSTCNIDCKYCFFLSKEALYQNDKQRMSEATLETYIQYPPRQKAASFNLDSVMASLGPAQAAAKAAAAKESAKQPEPTLAK
jgi:hypothetical protein